MSVKPIIPSINTDNNTNEIKTGSDPDEPSLPCSE